MFYRVPKLFLSSCSCSTGSMKKMYENVLEKIHILYNVNNYENDHYDYLRKKKREYEKLKVCLQNGFSCI